MAIVRCGANRHLASLPRRPLHDYP
jgi:hypothetical protein